MSGVDDLDNIIYKYIRNIRPINIIKLNNEIKRIEFQYKILMGKYEKLLTYCYKSYPNSDSYCVLLINCCKKCGNFTTKMRNKVDKIICKCN